MTGSSHFEQRLNAYYNRMYAEEAKAIALKATMPLPKMPKPLPVGVMASALATAGDLKELRGRDWILRLREAMGQAVAEHHVREYQCLKLYISRAAVEFFEAHSGGTALMREFNKMLDSKVFRMTRKLPPQRLIGERLQIYADGTGPDEAPERAGQVGIIFAQLALGENHPHDDHFWETAALAANEYIVSSLNQRDILVHNMDPESYRNYKY